MRLITANVNGIRAAARRGGLTWLAAQRPDAITMQEVRAGDHDVEKALSDAGLGDWHVAHTEAVHKGRAGVAVVTRDEPTRVALEVGDPEFADSGRWAEADLLTPAGPLTIVSAYVHAGEAGTERQLAKYRFLAAIERRLAEFAAADRLAVLTGDLNVAHHEHDLKNWKGNLAKSGFLPEERAVFDRWQAAGWVDVTRHLHGPGPGPYSWWSWRGKAFDSDAGWRIDYHWASPALARHATAARIGRAAAYDQRWSDHAAVLVDYDLG
jgi:exodeoxyribonuclease-3